MDELIKLHNALTNLISNWDSLIDKFLLEFEPYFIDIVNEQLDKGKDGDGLNLEPLYSPFYSSFKKSIGSLSAPVPDLKVTGEWREGMTMNKDFEIFSTDFKDSSLRIRYGDNITEVQTENMNKLIKDQILPEFEAFIKIKLGL